MSAPGSPRIAWSTAEISDGALSVELEGETPKGWAKRFDSVLTVLSQPSDPWGEITTGKGVLTVAAIREGSEDDLRHLLESALRQANADLERPTAAADAQPDRELAMRDKFRSFGSRESE